MSDSSRSMEVLKKILNKGAIKKAPIKKNEELLEKFFSMQKDRKITVPKTRRPGRPQKEDEFKARNFTICLDPKYIKFLDGLKVHDEKVRGRSRKLKFIIDQFLELHQRQRRQLESLSAGLDNVEKVLSRFSDSAEKGKKLELTLSEKREITKVVGQVQILVKVLSFERKDLHRLLPKKKWGIYSFCLDWTMKEKVSV